MGHSRKGLIFRGPGRTLKIRVVSVCLQEVNVQPAVAGCVNGVMAGRTNRRMLAIISLFNRHHLEKVRPDVNVISFTVRADSEIKEPRDSTGSR